MLIKTGRWIKKAFIGILLFMLVQVPVLADGYWPWWGETQSDVQVWQHWGALIGLTVVVGIVLLIIYKKVNFEDMSVKKITVSMAVKAIVVAIVLVLLEMVIAVVFSKQPESENYEIVQLIRSPLGILTLVSSNIVSPVLEELLFRGVIQSVLRESLPGVLAIILTNILFALGHGYQLGSTLGMVVVGCGCSWLLIKTKNLSVPILSHMTINLLVTLINLVAV